MIFQKSQLPITKGGKSRERLQNGRGFDGKKYFMKNFHKKLIYYEKYHYFSKLNEDVMKCNEAIITFE